MEYPATAIDFKQLMRDEKLRARQERHRQKNDHQQQPQKSSNETTRAIIDSVNSEQSTTTDGKETSTLLPASIPLSSDIVAADIPDDWLVSSINDDDCQVVNPFPTKLDRIQHCVSQDPPSIYYIPNFLPSSAQEYLKLWLSRLPHVTSNNKDTASHTSPNGKWTTLRYARRRVALLDGQQDNNDNNVGLPYPIQQLAQALVEARIFTADAPPNHVLINEYFEPTQGIMPHTDGPLYAPITATISMGGGDVLLNFTPRRRDNEELKEEQDSSVSHATATTADNNSAPRSTEPIVCRQVWLQGNGSLVVFTEDAYTNHLHGIQENTEMEEASTVCANAAPGTQIVRGYRISLTFRHKLAA